jgi:hypothetical protein
VFRDSFE